LPAKCVLHSGRRVCWAGQAQRKGSSSPPIQELWATRAVLRFEHSAPPIVPSVGHLGTTVTVLRETWKRWLGLKCSTTPWVNVLSRTGLISVGAGSPYRTSSPFSSCSPSHSSATRGSVPIPLLGKTCCPRARLGSGGQASIKHRTSWHWDRGLARLQNCQPLRFCSL
jgi:hypothetical protein